MSSVQPLLDAAGRRRSPATTPGFRIGTAPRNKGQRYPADPPTVDEIVAVMRQASHDRHGHRLNALIVVLWRAGLRIHEALSLTETDLDQRRGSILVSHGKNNRRREVGMDAWAWSAIEPWLADRLKLPVGALFCVIDGPTRGAALADHARPHQYADPWVMPTMPGELLHGSSCATSRSKAGVRRRFAPEVDLAVGRSA
jgi:integrase